MNNRNVRPLTNTSSGSFDELLVRSPVDGPYINVLDLIATGGGTGATDLSGVQAAIATNGARIDNTVLATTANAEAIEDCRTIADSYSKSATDTLLLAKADKSAVDTALLQKHPTITVRAAGVDYTGVTVIDALQASVLNGPLSLDQFAPSSLSSTG